MSDDIRIEPVLSRRDLTRFIKFPWKIYGDTPQWVPPLIMDQKVLLTPGRNPFFDHADVQHFLAYRNGTTAGRISAIIDRNYIEFQGEKAGFFGFFESFDDPAVARALFGAAERWVRERGMVKLLGPTNPSTNDTIGILLDAFDKSPMIMMPYNPSYYPDLLSGYGLRKAKDLHAYYIDGNMVNLAKLKRVSEITMKRHNLTVRTADLKHLKREIDAIKEIYNDAWEKNWGFVPWTDDEIEHLGKALKTVAEPRLVIFVYKDGEPAGFGLTLPDLYQAVIKVRSGRLFPLGALKLLWYSRKIDQLRVLAMGVKMSCRGIGLEAIIVYETYKNAIEELGTTNTECSWVLEDNTPMRNSMNGLGGVIYKTYRMYEKVLDGE